MSSLAVSTCDVALSPPPRAWPLPNSHPQLAVVHSESLLKLVPMLVVYVTTHAQTVEPKKVVLKG